MFLHLVNSNELEGSYISMLPINKPQAKRIARYTYEILLPNCLKITYVRNVLISA